MPTPSLPPKDNEEFDRWNSLLEECVDGRWFLVKTYKNRNTAKTVISQQRTRQRPGRWQFKAGGIDDRCGVWARNLDGPRVGEDEQ